VDTYTQSNITSINVIKGGWLRGAVIFKVESRTLHATLGKFLKTAKLDVHAWGKTIDTECQATRMIWLGNSLVDNQIKKGVI
jgi:hypothetical protein